MRRRTERVAVIGAGPYGLSVTAHLRAAGIQPRVFGSAMDFWQRMPRGMFLRSSKRASSLSDPDRRLTLDAYSRATGEPLGVPIELEQFLAYGRWFAEQVAPELDARRVRHITPEGNGFILELSDGTRQDVDSVVVSAGLSPFPRVPAALASVPKDLWSHLSEHGDLGAFRGRDVAVIGLGQSALESAALLHEGGARVEVIGRSSKLSWLPDPPHGTRRFRQRFYPPTDVGGLFNGWLAAVPDAFRRAPADKQPIWAHNAIRPAGAYWLRGRLRDGVRISTGCAIADACAKNDRLSLTLSDGSERIVDHALLGTGYAVDVAKYPFLGPDILDRLTCAQGYPVLAPGLESSVPGLHFVGAPAAVSFGPVMRFVVGASYAAPAVTRAVTQRRQPLVSFAF